MLKWTITSKTIVFIVTMSIKTYVVQKLMNICSAEVDEHFVCEREPLYSSDRYAVAILKDIYCCGQLSRILSLLLLENGTIAGMCPQWSAVVCTDHHSEQIATTTISLISTKISKPMKMLIPYKLILMVNMIS